MFWTRRQREPDAIDRICTLLREKWYEWTTTGANVVHLSGVVIHIGNHNSSKDRPYIWLGTTTHTKMPSTDAEDRLYAAYQDYLANRASSTKGTFDSTAIALANAIIAGDRTAAYGLADRIKETMEEQ